MGIVGAVRVPSCHTGAAVVLAESGIGGLADLVQRPASPLPVLRPGPLALLDGEHRVDWVNLEITNDGHEQLVLYAGRQRASDREVGRDVRLKIISHGFMALVMVVPPASK